LSLPIARRRSPRETLLLAALAATLIAAGWPWLSQRLRPNAALAVVSDRVCRGGQSTGDRAHLAGVLIYREGGAMDQRAARFVECVVRCGDAPRLRAVNDGLLQAQVRPFVGEPDVEVDLAELLLLTGYATLDRGETSALPPGAARRLERAALLARGMCFGYWYVQGSRWNVESCAGLSDHQRGWYDCSPRGISASITWLLPCLDEPRARSEDDVAACAWFEEAAEHFETEFPWITDPGGTSSASAGR